MTDSAYGNYLKLIAKTPVPKEDIQFFSSIGWTKHYIEDASYQAITIPSRILKPTGEDNFFAKIIKTPETIPQWVTLKLKTFKSPSEKAKGSLSLRIDNRKPFTAPAQPDFIVLLELRPDLNGYLDTTHGGVIATIFDEVLGICLEFHRQLLTESLATLFTSSLNITYKQQVLTPNIVAVRCWLEGREGRKWIMRGQMIDRDGTILAEAEGLWIAAKPEKL